MLSSAIKYLKTLHKAKISKPPHKVDFGGLWGGDFGEFWEPGFGWFLGGVALIGS